MKKLVFGLIATVMLSSSSFAQDSTEIVNSKDWQTIVNNNVKILNLIIDSNIDVKDIDLMNSDKIYSLIKLDKKEAMKLLEDSKTAASNLNSIYFNDTEKCESCSLNSSENWSQIASKIEFFRNNKNAYKDFLNNIGYSNLTAKVNCNNWRFYMCGGACVITCELPPIFAGCLMMCTAQFC